MKKDWASILSHHLCVGVDIVPADWKTTEQISKEWGRSVQRTQHGIAVALKKGAIEKKFFMIECGKRKMKIPHYRIIK